MKRFFVVPRMHIREALNQGEVDRLTATGSWVEVPEHKMRPPTLVALRMRRYRKRKRNPREKDKTD